jgi:hypothetical protein
MGLFQVGIVGDMFLAMEFISLFFTEMGFFKGIWGLCGFLYSEGTCFIIVGNCFNGLWISKGVLFIYGEKGVVSRWVMLLTFFATKQQVNFLFAAGVFLVQCRYFFSGIVGILCINECDVF